MTATEPRSVVVRLRPEGTRRLQALLAAPGPHLEPVLEVGRAPNGDLLLVVPQPAARLADLLLVPGWPTAGEAVTVLVPLAQSLAELHAAGVAHAAVGASAVLLDEDGAPYWAGPDEPVLRRAAGAEAFAIAVAADVVAFRTLCRSLLGPAAPTVTEPADLAAALFGIAEPVPVRLRPAPMLTERTGTPSRLLPAADSAAGVDAPRASALRSAMVALRTVRLRVWLAAGTVALLLAVVPVLLPADRSAPAATSAAGTTSPRAVVAVPTVAGTRAPIDALRALIGARARCLAAGSERCLRGVDAAGSPALQADSDAVASGTEAQRVDPDRLVLRTSGGGLALADADGTTVLAVREPQGWRLRDVVAPHR